MGKRDEDQDPFALKSDGGDSDVTFVDLKVGIIETQVKSEECEVE